MKNPYDTLGVRRDASPEEIKRAYRGKAKAHHPDAGGRQDEMADLTGAYAILSSPERRKAYDETGNDRQRDAFTQAINLATRIAVAVLKNEQVDPALVINEHRKKYTAEYQQKKAELEEQLEEMKRATARIKNRPENDFVGNFIEGQTHATKRALERVEEDFAIQQQALEYVSEYTFEKPAAKYAHYTTLGATASGTYFP